VPGFVRALPICSGCPARAVSYASIKAGDHGRPGNGIFLKPARRKYQRGLPWRSMNPWQYRGGRRLRRLSTGTSSRWPSMRITGSLSLKNTLENHKSVFVATDVDLVERGLNF
jgi:hypothetical protein